MHKIIKALAMTSFIVLTNYSHATEQPINFETTIESVLAPEQEKLFAGQTEKDDSHSFYIETRSDLKKTSQIDCYYQTNLAQIINTAYLEQARPEEFSCDGLTTQQISTLDFNKINFPNNFLSDLRNRMDQDHGLLEGNTYFQQYKKTQQEAIDYAYVYAITTTKNKD